MLTELHSAAGQGWTEARETRLSLTVPAVTGRVWFQLDIDPQTEPRVSRPRRVALRVGPAESRRTIAGPFTFHADLPRGAADLCLVDEDFAPGTPGLRITGWRLWQDTSLPPPAPVRPVLEIPFGWNEPTSHWLGDGFGPPEDAYSWAVGGRSALRLPVLAPGQPMLALLDMTPALEPGQTCQHVTALCNSMPVARLRLTTRAVMAVELWPEPDAKTVALTFLNQDAAAPVSGPRYHLGHAFAFMLHSVRLVPALPRLLAGARPPVPGTLGDGSLQANLQALTGMTPADLLGEVESLGNICELGNVRAAYRHDSRGLMRFAGIWQWQLIRALFAGFDRFAPPGGLSFHIRDVADGHWRLTESTYGVGLGTPYPLDKPPPAPDREARSLARLASQLLEDIAAGTLLFCMRTEYAAEAPERLAVLAALRHRGQADLLWLSDKPGPPRGSAQRLEPGFYEAWFEPPDGNRARSHEAMLSAIANALTLRRQAQPLAPHFATPIRFL